MTGLQGVTQGETSRAVAVLCGRGHKGRRDWYVGSDELGRGVMTEGKPKRRLDPDEAVAVAVGLYGMRRDARAEGRYG